MSENTEISETGGPGKISSEISILNEPEVSNLEKLLETEASKVSEEVKPLPETEVSPENQMTVSASPPYENKTRPPISILPSNPAEKREHVIKMVLEKATNLSFNYGSKISIILLA